MPSRHRWTIPAWCWLTPCLLVLACRVERVSPRADAPAACADEAPRGELWVYTSMYPAIVDALEPLAKQKMPDVTLRWFRAGSEKVAQRLDAELQSGAPQADVVATSDPFFYERLARAGHLLPYASIHALRLPRSLVDPDGRHVTVRVSAMALAFRTDLADPPASWKDLVDPKWKGRVALGDPLGSGTAFTWTTFAAGTLDPLYFQRLRDNGAVVAGGNSAVQQRLETRESDVGVLLEENVRLAKKKGAALSFVRPSEGVVVVPGQAAILAKSRNTTAARAFVDLLLSDEGQRLIVDPGEMHAVDPRLPGPSGEEGIESLLRGSMPWTPQLLESGTTGAASLKESFSKVFSQ